MWVSLWNEVPGWKVQGIQGETTSSTHCWVSAEQTDSSSGTDEAQQSVPGLGLTKRWSKSIRVNEGDSFSHCKDKCQGSQSRRGSLEKCVIGIRQEDEEANQKRNEPNTGSDIPLDTIVIIDDDDSGIHTGDVTSDTEQDGDDITTEMNTGDVILDTELEGDDIAIESDARQSRHIHSYCREPVGKTPGSRHPGYFSVDVSDDEDDCQMFEPCRRQQFTSMGSMRKLYRQRSDGCYSYVLESSKSPSSTSSDCQILEGCHGEIRQKWEEAALRKRVAQGLHRRQFEDETEVSVSASNLRTNSPSRESKPEVTNKRQGADFEGHHAGRGLQDLSDFVNASGINNTSCQMNEASPRTFKELEIEKPSTSVANSSNGVAPGQLTNTIEIHQYTETSKLDESSNVIRVNKPLPELTHLESHQEENLGVVDSSEGAKAELGMTDKLREWIGDREKLKETAEFRRADQEEWARRHLELQRQAEEVQRLRRRKRAEADRVLEMERRQKRRLEEIRETQKKDKKTMDLKEQVRGQVRAELERMASNCKDMASLLRQLGIPVEGGAIPSSQQVNAAYKQALLRFHPDRASVSKGGLRHQVEAEETFKLISRLKDTLLPTATT